MPHAIVPAVISLGVLTIVIQDARRVDIPLARLYYYERIEEMGSQVERKVRMESPDFSAVDRAVWERFKQDVKGLAWADYRNRFGQYFRN